MGRNLYLVTLPPQFSTLGRKTLYLLANLANCYISHSPIDVIFDVRGVESQGRAVHLAGLAVVLELEVLRDVVGEGEEDGERDEAPLHLAKLPVGGGGQ